MEEFIPPTLCYIQLTVKKDHIFLLSWSSDYSIYDITDQKRNLPSYMRHEGRQNNPKFAVNDSRCDKKSIYKGRCFGILRWQYHKTACLLESNIPSFVFLVNFLYFALGSQQRIRKFRIALQNLIITITCQKVLFIKSVDISPKTVGTNPSPQAPAFFS